MLVPGPVNWNLASDVPPSTSSVRVPVRLNEWGSDRSKKTSKKEFARALTVPGALVPMVSACPLPAKLAGRMLLVSEPEAVVLGAVAVAGPTLKTPKVVVLVPVKESGVAWRSRTRLADVTMGSACAGATDRNTVTAKAVKPLALVIVPSVVSRWAALQSWLRRRW